MNLRQREPRYENRAYLDLAYVPGKTCVRCGSPGGEPCEPCHYSGKYGDRVGRGGSRKAPDLHAELCRACHNHFDQYEGGNDDARAAEFLLLILKTLARNLHDGHAYLSVLTLVRESADAPTASAPGPNTVGRIKRLRAFTAKTGHRNGASTRSPLKAKIGARQ